MRTTNKKVIDTMAEARKMPGFSEIFSDANMRLRLAVEIYQSREKLGLSQQDLAKIIKSTQKVISHLESGDVNLGLSLLNRISSALHFNADNWARILDFDLPGIKFVVSAQASQCGRVIKQSNISETDASFNLSKLF
ncbi:helix-turn-helix domain-containing protein [Patescibacteria group bacterium]|nr:helix-turn-helix domain-containing protein [Patescibacteria group bacterium]